VSQKRDLERIILESALIKNAYDRINTDNNIFYLKERK